MVKGKIEIVKMEPDRYNVAIGPKERIEGLMRYGLDFTGGGVENHPDNPMETGHSGPKFSEWPPTTVDGAKKLQGYVNGPKKDQFFVTDLERLRAYLWSTEDVKSFDMVYRDETVKPPKTETVAEDVTEATWFVSPWANPMVKAGVGVVGVAVVTGFVGRWLGWW